MTVAPATGGAPMWTPSAAFADSSRIAAFMAWLRRER